MEKPLLTTTPRRFANIVGLREEHIEEYKRLHADVWPDVLAQIRRSNIRNYSIFLKRMPDGKYYLFSYFEYTGSDYEADMAAMSADPASQKWWTITKPIQEPLPETDVANGGWWSPTEEVFHTD